MKNNILKYLSMFTVLLVLTLSAVSAFAQGRTNFDLLFSPIERDYTPVPQNQIEDVKISALQTKNAEQMYALGMMHVEGNNIEQDFIQAREWFQKSSNLGNVKAMVELAKLYTMDKRVTRFDASNTKAKEWIRKAEVTGADKALFQKALWYENGIVFQKDPAKALEYFEKSASLGNINSDVKLFLYYYFGKGVEADTQKAIHYLRKIKKNTKSEYARAISSKFLGEIYMAIAVQNSDPEIKFKLYEVAWANNNSKAADALGDMYSEGIGVKKNYLMAEEWYQKSVELSESIYSMEKLGLLYMKGPGDIERDYTKAFDMFKRASELGGVQGAHYLGYMYYYGLGIEKDQELAQVWFERSKKNAARNQKYGTLDNIEYETDVNKMIDRR